MRQPAEGDHAQISTEFAAGVSDIGKRHRRNEDAMALLCLDAPRPAVVAVVCDGVSSSPRPEEASRAAADTGAAALAEKVTAGTDPAEATRAALAEAVQAVNRLAPSPEHAPACTYLSAVVTADPPGSGPGAGQSVTIGWVGDSRAYWVASEPGAEPDALLTRDDSWAEYMVAQGALSREEARAAPTANALVGWVGADAGEVTGHIATLAPSGSGALVLCSDGLWNYLPGPADLAGAVRGMEDPLHAARSYTRIANDEGGRDNITVVVIPIPLQRRHPGSPQR